MCISAGVLNGRYFTVAFTTAVIAEKVLQGKL